MTDVLKIIAACMRILFGNDILIAKYDRIYVDGKRKRVPSFLLNMNELKLHKSLFNFRDVSYDITRLDIRNK